MLTSFALIFIVEMALSQVFQLMRLPSLIGMVLTGIVLGSFVLDIIDPSLLAISADLRQMTLIVILIRAGLTLNLKDLKKVGRPAIFMVLSIMISAPLGSIGIDLTKEHLLTRAE